MNYNEVTFRIFPRKKNESEGKEDFRRVLSEIHFRAKSSLNCIYYI